VGFLRLQAEEDVNYLIEHIECLADRCPDRVASVDELSVVTDVFVEVIKQFLRDFDADLRHTLVFAEEYLHSVAQPIGLAGSSFYYTINASNGVVALGDVPSDDAE